ncbi:hypothetical protein SAOV_1912c [Staphylococcus aureus subsp. aureus ED133]|nr:hypothetical protein SAOV_1912c [Staphylococcus aureus subsp. aureus ED133]
MSKLDRWWLSEYKEVVPMVALLKSLERRRLCGICC